MPKYERPKKAQMKTAVITPLANLNLGKARGRNRSVSFSKVDYKAFQLLALPQEERGIGEGAASGTEANGKGM